MKSNVDSESPVAPATQLPWYVAGDFTYFVYSKDGGAGGYIVADCGGNGFPPGPQDAAYIVKSANAYPKLVAQLRDYHETVAERTRRERAAEKREVRDVVFGAALVYLVFFLVAWLK